MCVFYAFNILSGSSQSVDGYWLRKLSICVVFQDRWPCVSVFRPVLEGCWGLCTAPSKPPRPPMVMYKRAEQREPSQMELNQTNTHRITMILKRGGECEVGMKGENRHRRGDGFVSIKKPERV